MAKSLWEIYRPNSPNEKRFIALHKAEKHDEPFNAEPQFKSNVKTIDRASKRMGANAGRSTSGEVCEEEQLDELTGKGQLGLMMAHYGRRAEREAHLAAKADDKGDKKSSAVHNNRAADYENQYERGSDLRKWRDSNRLTHKKARRNALYWSKGSVREDVQLDEISKDLAKRYLSKSLDDERARHLKAHKELGDDRWKDPDFKRKITNRQKSQSMARGRITDEKWKGTGYDRGGYHAMRWKKSGDVEMHTTPVNYGSPNSDAEFKRSHSEHKKFIRTQNKSSKNSCSGKNSCGKKS